MGNFTMPPKNQGAKAAAVFAAHLPTLFRDRLGMALTPIPGFFDNEGFDLGFEFRVNNERLRLLVDVKSRWLHRDLALLRSRSKHLEGPHNIPLLAVPVLSPRIRHELRQAGINHADLRGTLYLRAPGIHIDVEGRPSTASSDSVIPMPGGGSSVNPFSDQASVVLRLLLNDVRRTWRIDELAEAGWTTPGWVSRVVRELEKRGYIRRSRHGSGRESDVRLSDPVAALRDWATAYTWRANTVTSYHVPFEQHEILHQLKTVLDQMILEKHGERQLRETPLADSLKVPFALTLLSASDLYAAHVEHEQVHAYIGRLQFPELDNAVRMQLHAVPAERGGNLHLFQPYYERSVFLDARTLNGSPVVSPAQLYIDLIQYPLRGQEATRVLVQTVLGPELNLSSEQIRELIE